MVDRPVFSKLSQIKQPTIIFFGEADQLIPNRYLKGGRTSEIAQKGHDKMTNSTLHMVPKAGHFVHFEQADYVNEKMLAFLK